MYELHVLLRFCMVGDRPVNLVGITELYGYTPNCTAEALEKAFCPEDENGTVACDPYFMRYKKTSKFSIKARASLLFHFRHFYFVHYY